MNIWKTQPGEAVAIAIGKEEQPLLRFAMDGWDLSNTAIIITSIAISERIDHAIAKTFSPSRFIYPFGEDIGDITLSGVVFARTCPPALAGLDAAAAAAVARSKKDGLTSVLEFFHKNNMYWRSKPISIRINDVGISAFLAAHRFNINDPAAGLGQFVLSFRLLDSTLLNG